MKRLFFILLSASFLFGCNQGNETQVKDEHADHDHAAEAATETKAQDENLLTLNNGAKWKSDLNTDKNVKALKTVADDFKNKANPGVEDYHNVANSLSEGLNTMIKECKMKGPDHDALHHWLEPVLKENNELRAVADTTAGSALFTSLNARLNAYPDYFELP
ncbi:MAG: hypothetical protein ABIP35_03635 [Ginsengibacter sp.]